MRVDLSLTKCGVHGFVIIEYWLAVLQVSVHDHLCASSFYLCKDHLSLQNFRLIFVSISLTEFIKKMKSWLAMSHFDEGFCRRVDLLERNFAVSNNIFKKYKPIFLDLFKNPLNDQPRPPRSRKQRRPPCNSTELFHFCWTLYILIKGENF